jgi:hypothetical protein
MQVGYEYRTIKVEDILHESRPVRFGDTGSHGGLLQFRGAAAGLEQGLKHVEERNRLDGQLSHTDFGSCPRSLADIVGIELLLWRKKGSVFWVRFRSNC